ncbi:MAG: RtcB family protein [Desulfobacterium sp.]|jgi:tRNA-splicing ligase RtcB|nr:RtcB family protein [Desulfobacterium sp.]
MEKTLSINQSIPFEIWGWENRLSDLAWLDPGRSERIEYWKAMELMGRCSSVNRYIIHQSVLNHLGAVSVLTLENHHNFAWKMQCGDEEVVVHHKGATPAYRSSKRH